MSLIRELKADPASRRSQHLVFLIHIWLFAPFLILWVTSKQVEQHLGADVMGQLRPVVFLTVGYLLARTVAALRGSEQLKWEYIFPPLDMALITLIIYMSHRGAMSNLTLLFFLPIVAAAGSLNVRWSAAVGLMAVLGLAISSLGATNPPSNVPTSMRDWLQDDPLNTAFRVYFLLVISSLMAYQALIASRVREKLSVSADRNRIAMEMHDGVQGNLIALSSQLELLGQIAVKDPSRATQVAHEARESARQAADELRFLVHRMRAPTLSQGFVPALKQFAHNICSRQGIELEFSVTGSEAALSPEAENCLFRVAQEALTNVAKHAQASRVTVQLQFGGSQTALFIEDNGRGFDRANCEGADGLAGMEDRLCKNGGTLMVRSELGRGTVVEARV